MIRLITGAIIVLLTANTLSAQYVNTDSLILIPGYQAPVTLHEYNSNLTSALMEEFSSENFWKNERISPLGLMLSQFEIPSDGKVISRFGIRSNRMHTGTDIKMPKGDTIYAAFYGTVTRAKYHYGYGNMVALDHGNNLETSYSHLSGFLVKVGENVVKGQPVGLAGSTGRATTSHLHFEIREENKPYDPELVFDFENGKVREEIRNISHLVQLQPESKMPVQYASHSSGQSDQKLYTVKNGDSLWKISKYYRTSVNTLCMLNNLNEKSVLRVGMVLKLQ
jgi:ribosomal protein L27